VQPLQHDENPGGDRRHCPSHERQNGQSAAAARHLPGLCRADPSATPLTGGNCNGAVGDADAAVPAIPRFQPIAPAARMQDHLTWQMRQVGLRRYSNPAGTIDTFHRQPDNGNGFGRQGLSGPPIQDDDREPDGRIEGDCCHVETAGPSALAEPRRPMDGRSAIVRAFAPPLQQGRPADRSAYVL